MLVNGWMINGALHSSYAYTMGLSVSAQGKDCTTRNRVTPPQKHNKINNLSHKHEVWRQVATGRLLWLVT